MFVVSKAEGVTCLKMARTLFGKPLRTACSYLVDGLAIDGGPPIFKKRLLRYFTDHRLEQAVFTHFHEDHAGNVDLFNHLGIVPNAHAETVGLLASPASIPYYRRFAWGTPAAGCCHQVGATIETEHYTFKVIPSPGHSTDHIVLYEEKKGWLFTGDLFLSEGIYYLYESEDLPAMKETLRQLSSLNFSTLFCSHRGALEKGPEALARKLNHIETLQEKALTLQRQGFSTSEITKKLLGKENYLYIISRGEFSKTAFTKALLS
jgi:glyoxylase-like metal-dependent hydrolase (beta-lactamase superfamily II)